MTLDAHTRDPAPDAVAWGERLAAAYRDIGDRAMRDLPIYNDALDVEAIGFRRFEGAVIGIMVTPWFMNVVMPADQIARAVSGSSLRVRLPAGEIELALSEVQPIGRIASCSLFSPMFGFADMAAARATAEAALAELMLPADNRAAATSTIDRRNFLRGALTERRL